MPTIIQSIGVSGDFGQMSFNDPSDGVAFSSTGTGAAPAFSLTDLAQSIHIKEYETLKYKIGINKTFASTQYALDVSGDLRVDTGPSGDRQGAHIRVQPNTRNFPGPNKIVLYETPFGTGQTPTTSIGLGVDTDTLKFHTTSDYKWYYTPSGTWDYIKDASGNNTSVGKMPTENGNLAMQLTNNDLSLNGNFNMHGNSINFSQPSVKFSIDKVLDFSDASCALILPTGTTSDRSLSTSVNGMVRFNHQTKKIEQYIDGWSGLKAAVADVDGDTYISAEEIVGNQPQNNDQLHFYTAGSKRMLIDNDGKIAIGNVSTDPSSNLHIFSGGTFTSNNVPAFGITAMTGSNFTADTGTTFPFMNLQTAAGTDYLRLNVINYNTGVTGTEDQVSFTGFGVSVKDGTNGFIDNAMAVHPQGNVGFGTITPMAKMHIRNANINNQPPLLIDYSGSDNFIKLNSISGSVDDLTGIKFTKSNVYDFSLEAKDQKINFKNSTAITLTTDLSKNLVGVRNTNPTVSLDVSGNDAIKIPIGTTAQRPTANDPAHLGLIRYNTTTSSYEGFGAGNAWGSLGGVKDVDQDTYISAENSAGADNDELKFFTAGTERMTIENNGYVGIGTNSPSNALTINGTNSDNTPILGLRSGNSQSTVNDGAQIAFGFNGTDDYQHFIHTRHSAGDTNQNAMDFYLSDNTQNNTVTSGSNHALTLTGSGRVGVGVTHPTVALDVNGSIKFTGDMQISGGMTSSADYITASASTSHDIILKAGTTERMRIKGNGNVGIGTVTPSEKLHVHGNIYSSGSGQFTGGSFNTTNTPSGVYLGAFSSTYGNIQIISSNADGGWIDWTDNITGSGSDFDGRIRYGSGGTNYAGMTFYTNGNNAERMRIDLNGNVGIGTTNPSNIFTVKTSTNNDGIKLINNTNHDNVKLGSNTTTGGYMNLYNTSGSLLTSLNTTGSSFLSDTSSTLGIGTNAAVSSKLDVRGSIRANYDTDTSSYFGRAAIGYTGWSDQASFAHIDKNDQSGFALLQNEDGRTILNAASGQPIMFKINNQEKMNLSSSGNLGIGTNAPASKLHVKYDGTGYAPGIIIENNGSGTGDNDANLELKSTDTGEPGIMFTHQGTRKWLISGGGDIMSGDFHVDDRENNKGRFMISKTTGYIGIGDDVYTLNPAVTLVINSTDAIKVPVGTTAQRPTATGTTHQGYIRYNTTTSSYEGFGAGNAWGSLGGIKDVDQDTYISAETTAGADNDELKFFTAGTERASIGSTGNVTIKNNLTVDGDFNITGVFNKTNTNVQVTDQLDISNNGTGPALIARQHGTANIADFYDDATLVMRIKNGGNIGIGTDNPSEKLHINDGNIILHSTSTINPSLYVGTGGSGTLANATNYLRMHNTSTHSYIDFKINDLYFRSNTTTRMIIKSDGNVGININPTEKLHVDGSIKLSGSLKTSSLTISQAELGYLDGVTASIQTQLNDITSGGIAISLDGISDVKSGGANFSESLLIGNTTTGTLNNANYNTGVGAGVFGSLTSGDENTASGYYALSNNTTGSLNTANGSMALYWNTTGYNNTATGYNALKDNTTGFDNSAFGVNTLNKNTTGYYNTAIGNTSLYANTTGNNNIATGYRTLRYNTTGSQNTAYGNNALYKNTTGTKNIATGNYALEDNTTGNFNVAYGYYALNSNTTASWNTAHGYESLKYNTTGSQNTAIGNATLNKNTTGGWNTATGGNALNLNTTGSDNVANGAYSLNRNTTGNNNVANGAYALRFNTTGSNNSALGRDALYSNTTASNNSALGYKALYSNTTGTYNVAVGTEALKTNTTGNYNTASGDYALNSNTTGTDNTATGYQALKYNTNGIRNVATGRNALYSNTTGNYNTSSGAYTLSSNTAGHSAVANGYQALANNTTGNLNTATGYQALYSNTTGGRNTATGYQSLTSTTGSYNTAYGYQAGNGNTTGTYNTFLGYNTDNNANNLTKATSIGWGATATASNQIRLGTATETVSIPGDLSLTGTLNSITSTELGYLDGVTSNIQTQIDDTALAAASQLDDFSDVKFGGANFSESLLIGNSTTGTLSNANYNTGVGAGVFGSLTSGDENTASGYYALSNNTTGTNNTANGSMALYWNTTGSNNTATGNYALQSNTEGDDNVATGYQSLKTNTTGTKNVADGYQSLFSNTEGDNNLATGRSALYGNTTGSNNTAVGYNAGVINTTGGNNTYLGYNATANANNLSNSTAIGTGATISASNQIMIGISNTTVSIPGNLSLTGTLNSITSTEIGYLDGVTSNIQTQINSAISGGVTSLDGLSDVKFGGTNFSESLLIGNTTTGTLSDAKKNTGVGYDVFKALTTGDYNTAIGHQSLRYNTTGITNSAFGTQTLYNNTSGAYNTVSGYQALKHNTTANENNAFGYRALFYNTTGSSNTANGYYALFNNTGAYNTAIGHSAGRDNTTGTYNTFLGYNTNNNASGLTKSTSIGWNATATASNQIRLGTATETVSIPGNLSLTGTLNNITSTELGYLDGVTSNIQTQLNNSSQWTTVNTNEIHYSSGKVGIGTNNPDRLLHVYRSTGASLEVSSPNTIMYFGTNDNIEAYMWINTDHDFKIGTNNTERIRIKNSGNVGIGTNNPSNTLTINGSSSSTTPPLGVRSGKGWNNFTGGQIAFGYDGRDEYQHFIHTRHHATNSNRSAMDFFISDGTEVNTLSSGSTHALTLTGSGRAGVGTTTPNESLDVSGNIVINNGATGSNQGGRLFFDAAINAAGPNKIKFLNTTDERFGIGLFTDEVRYFTSNKHSFQYQPPDENHVKYIKINQNGQTIPMYEVSLYLGTTDIAQGKTVRFGTNNASFASSTANASGNGYQSGTSNTLTDNNLTTFHRTNDGDDGNYYVILDDNVVFQNLSAIVIRGLNRSGGDVLTKRFFQGSGTNYRMTLFDSNFNQVWLAPTYQGNNSTIFHTVHVFALGQYNSSNFTTYSKNNTASVTASYSYSAPGSLPSGVTPSLVEQIKFDTDTVTIPGNLVVSGTTTTLNTTNTTISDNLIELSSGLTGAANNDAGIIIERGSTGDNAFMGWDVSQDKFVLGTTTATGSSTGNLSITKGNLDINNVSATTITLNGTDLQTKIDNATYDVVNFTVTVGTKTNAHPQYATGSTSAFFINGIESPAITFKSGTIYTFDQSNSSNSGNLLKLWTNEGSTTQYSTGCTFSGTAGSSGADLVFIPDDDTPLKLYYQNGTNKYMGNYAATQVAVETVTNTHLSYANYLNGVSSNIQTQIDDLSSGGASQWTTVNTNEIHYSSGNVGIGTNNPTQKLDVRGNIYSTGSGQFTGGAFNSENSPPGVYLGALSSTYGNMQIISSSADGGWIDWTDNITGSGSDFDGRIRYGSGNTNYAGMTFYTNGNNAERMRIDLNGNLGIGTNNPASKLDVNGSIRAAYNTNTTSYFGRAAVGYCGHSDATSLSHIDNNTTTNYAFLQSANGSTYINSPSSASGILFRINNVDKMRMLTNGNFGIATNTPSEKLEVIGNIKASGTITSAANTNAMSQFGYMEIGSQSAMNGSALIGHSSVVNNTSAGYALMQNSFGDTYLNASTTSRSITLRIADVEKMRVHTNGFIGIGSAAPDYKLTLDGGVLSTGVGYSASRIIYYDDFNGLASGWTNVNSGGLTTTGGYTRLHSGCQIRSAAIDLPDSLYYRDGQYIANRTMISTRTLLKIMGRSWTQDTAAELITISILKASDNSLIDIIYKDCGNNQTTPPEFYPIICDITPYITSSINSIKILISLGGSGSADHFELKHFSICLDDSSPWYKNSVYKQQVIGGLSVGNSYIGEDLNSNNLIVEGSVGIGTTNPTSSALDVRGSIRANYDTDTTSYFGRAAIGNSTYSNYAAFGHLDKNNAGGYALLQGSGGNTFINSSTGQMISFRINNYNKMVLSSDGKLGIGTASPQSILHTYSLDTADTNNKPSITTLTANDFNSTHGSSWKWISATNKSHGTSYSGLTTNGGEEFQQVGINLINYNAGGSGQFGMNSRARTGIGFTVRNLTTLNENALVISNTANVGIGSIIPAYKLDVTGDINFTGTLRQNGSAFSSGASSLNGLSDVKFGGTNFSYSLLIGNTNTGTLSNANYNTGVGSGVFNSITNGERNTASGYQALYNNTTADYNTATGMQTLYHNSTGSDNTASGYRALHSNTTGSNNSALGRDALYSSTTAVQNTAIGHSSMRNITTGGYNVSLGYESMKDANTSQQCVAIGLSALKNGSPYDSTAVGAYAAFQATSGRDLTAVGRASLYAVTTGSYNTAIGTNSIKNVNTGSYNTGIGKDTGLSLSSGSYNTFLGKDANINSGSSSYRTVIGSGATGTVNNSVTLGRSSDIVTIPGKIGIGTNNPSTALQIGNNLAHDSSRTYDVNALKIVHPTVTSTTVLNDPKPLLYLAREGTSGEAHSAAAIFKLSRYEHNSTNSRTRMDIDLTDNNFQDQNVMTLRADGKVGISTDAPARTLDLSNTGQITFGDTATGNNTSNPGMYWHSGDAYGIYRTSGNWTGDYQQLMIKFNTGIILNPGSGSTNKSHVGIVGGLSVGDTYYTTKSDNNIIVQGNVGIGTNNPSRKLEVVSTDTYVAEFKNTSQYSRLVLDGAASTGADLIFSQNGTSKWGIANIGDDLFFMGDDHGDQKYMTILNNGKVGIGTNSPTSSLHLYEPTGTSGGANGVGTLVIEHGNDAGHSSIVFPSAVNKTSDYGYIRYQDDRSNSTSNERAVLTIGLQNDGDDHIALMPSGNVGVSTNTPTEKLHVIGSIKLTGSLKTSSVELTQTELGYLNGVTSNIQTQLNAAGGASSLDGLSDVKFGGSNFSNSLLIGNTNTGTLSSANDNTGTGVGVFNSLTSGEYNSAYGASALYSNTTGTLNTAIGYNALYSNTTASNNTAVGMNALKINTTGYQNTAIGRNALYANTTGIDNTANGYVALRHNTTGQRNTAYGSVALFNNTTGIDNNASGYEVLKANTTGNRNTATGNNALLSNTTGSQNTAYGNYALKTNTSGSYNNATGYWALADNTASYNTASGVYALRYNTTGANNTACGYESLKSSTTGTGNVAIGYQAGDLNTTGTYNTFLGYNTDNNANNLTKSTSIGWNATATASNQIRLGTATETVSIPGDLSLTGTLNNITATEIGYLDGVTSNIQTQLNAAGGGGASSLDGLSDVKSGGTNFTNSLLIGNTNTGTLSNATYNTGVGVGVFNALTSGNMNTATGYYSLYYNTTGSANTGYGFGALYTNTTGIRNTAVGMQALNFVSTGNNNTAVGYTALYNATTASNNTAIGYGALYSNTTGIDNTASGYRTLYTNTTGHWNSAHGRQSLFYNTTGERNTASGYESLFKNTTGKYNTAIGMQTLYQNQTSDNITSIGHEAFYNTTAAGGVAIGAKALRASTTGAYNTAIGYNAGAINTTGASNTYLGYNTNATANNLSNSTAIGTGATISASNQIRLGTATETVSIPGPSSLSGLLTATGGAKISVQNSQDGGQGRGIYMWDDTDEGWGIYMGQSGASRSLSGGTACTGAGFSSHSIRFRAYNTSTKGFIFENSDEQCLHSIRASDGQAYFKGNVGIGILNPSKKLHVNGDAQLDIMPGHEVVGTLTIGRQDQPTYRQHTMTFYNSSTQANNYMAFNIHDGTGSSSAPVERMRILGNGYVGIGTDTPSSKLDVYNGTVTIQNDNGTNLLIKTAAEHTADSLVEIRGARNSSTTQVPTRLNFTNYDSDISATKIMGSIYGMVTDTTNNYGSLHFGTAANGTTISTRMTILSDGNVGIGDATPSSKLDVAGSVRGAYNTDTTSYFGRAAIGYASYSDWASFSHLDRTSAGNYALLQDADGMTLLNASSGEPIQFMINNSVKMYLSSAGNFGIGNASPSYKLDVTGDINFTGTLYQNGSAFSGGGGASSLDGLSDVKSGGSNFSNSLLIGNTTTGTLSGANYNTGIGVGVFNALTSGTANVATGYQALYYNTTGAGNTASGFRALYSNTTGNYNVATGYNALRQNTTGIDNTAVGYQALYSNTTGQDNMAIGWKALYNNTTGHWNSAPGMYSLFYNTTGQRNAASGYASLFRNTTGNYNTAHGMQSLYSNQTGSNITAIGHEALHFNTASDSVAVGYNALRQNTTGTGNVATGSEALRTNTTGGSNTATGYRALYSNTTGVDNTASGYRALYSNTTGHWNSAHGKQSLFYNTSGQRNAASGYESLFKNTTGNYNTTHGMQSLYNNQTGDNITSLGHEAFYNTTADGGVAIGAKALKASTTGAYNTAIGYNAGAINTTGTYNTFLGYNTDNNANNLTKTTAIGWNATATASNQIRLGTATETVSIPGPSSLSGLLTATGGAKISVQNSQDGGTGRGIYMWDDNDTNWGIYMGTSGGSKSLSGNTACAGASFSSHAIRFRVNNGSSQGFIFENGTTEQCLHSIRGDDGLAYFKGNVGFNKTNPAYNIDVTGDINFTGTLYQNGSAFSGGGASSLDGLSDVKSDGTNFTESLLIGDTTTGTLGGANYNTGVGFKVFNALTSGDYNTALGWNALNDLTTGSYNIAIGSLSLFTHTSGSYNTTTGAETLRYNTTGSSICAYGYQSLRSNTASYSSAFGYQSLWANTTGAGNSAFGMQALYSNTTGTQHTASGYQALRYNTTGNYNAAYGYQALYNNTTGSENTAIGPNALSSNTTGSWNIAIGRSSLYWNTTGSYNFAAGYKVLLANTTGQKNTASGYKALYSNTTGNLNTATGHEALRNNTTGLYNVAMGGDTMKNNTTGSYNVAVGLQCMIGNTTGAVNTAMGFDCFKMNTTGASNVAMGGQCLQKSTTGSNNTSIGKMALHNNTTASSNSVLGAGGGYYVTTGQYNTLIGQAAGQVITTGNYNTILGYDSEVHSNVSSYSTVIGAGATGTANNQIRLGRSTDAVSIPGDLQVGNDGGTTQTFLNENANYSFVGGLGGSDSSDTFTSSNSDLASLIVGEYGTQTSTFRKLGHLDTDGASSGNNDKTVKISAYFRESIVVHQTVFIHSDNRIKKNVNELNDNSALIQFRKLKPCTYNYLDTINRGDKTVFGYIAQEVADVIPEAVSIKNDFIPNILCNVDVDISNNFLTASNIDLGSNPYNLNTNFNDLSLNAIDSSGNQYAEIKIYTPTGKTLIRRVSNIINNTTIEFYPSIEPEVVLDPSSNRFEAFVHGQKVKDFHTLDKNSIFTLASSALQEVDRQQQADKTEIAQLKTKVTTLETKVTSLETQMAAVLLRLQALENP